MNAWGNALTLSAVNSAADALVDREVVNGIAPSVSRRLPSRALLEEDGLLTSAGPMPRPCALAAPESPAQARCGLCRKLSLPLQSARR
jgi:hypothetical protein